MPDRGWFLPQEGLQFQGFLLLEIARVGAEVVAKFLKALLIVGGTVQLLGYLRLTNAVVFHPTGLSGDICCFGASSCGICCCGPSGGVCCLFRFIPGLEIV